MAVIRWAIGLALLSLLASGCSDGRVKPLGQGVEIVVELLGHPDLKGMSAQQAVDHLFSRQGQELWPERPGLPELAYRSSQDGRQPARILFLRAPDAPWSVVVTAQGDHVLVEGFGTSLEKPLMTTSLKFAETK